MKAITTIISIHFLFLSAGCMGPSVVKHGYKLDKDEAFVVFRLTSNKGNSEIIFEHMNDGTWSPYTFFGRVESSDAMGDNLHEKIVTRIVKAGKYKPSQVKFIVSKNAYFQNKFKHSTGTYDLKPGRINYLGDVQVNVGSRNKYVASLNKNVTSTYITYKITDNKSSTLKGAKLQLPWLFRDYKVAN